MYFTKGQAVTPSSRSAIYDYCELENQTDTKSKIQIRSVMRIPDLLGSAPDVQIGAKKIIFDPF